MWHQRRTSRSAISALIALALVLAACGGDSDSEPTEAAPTAVPEATATPEAPADVDPDPEADVEPEPTAAAPTPTPLEITGPPVEDPEGETGTNSEPAAAGPVAGADLGPLGQTVVADLVTAFSYNTAVWPGFQMADYPLAVVLPGTDGAETQMLVFGLPDPTLLGNAQPVTDLDGLFLVSNLSDEPPEPANGLFDFFVPLAGTESFVILADPNEPLLPPGSQQFPGFMLHEQFHLYQETWDGTLFDQSVAYDLSAENIELALLEDAALIAAFEGQALPETELALQHFAALRTTRLAMFDSAQLDNSQEWSEGTAQWIDYRGLGVLALPYDDSGFGVGLGLPEASIDAVGVEGWFSWQRFYYTGATQIELLDRVGAANLQEKFEQGVYPSELVRQMYPLSEQAAALLVDDARAIYDPAGALAALAQDWAQ